jgi:nicotinamidase/pyrazinamidase
MRKALIIVDMQNDFVRPDGALPVPRAEELIEPIIEQMKRGRYDMILTTQDWHPADGDFGHWPQHCVAGTKGALIVDEIESWLTALGVWSVHVYKGQQDAAEGYSGFESGALDRILSRGLITHVDIVGVALDYCVKATAADATRLGYRTTILVHLTRAVGS